MTGTSGRQRVPAKALAYFPLVAPPKNVADAFGFLVRPLFSQASGNARVSRTLTTLRDHATSQTHNRAKFACADAEKDNRGRSVSSLKEFEKLYLEKILGMGDGWVLDHSDASYGKFFNRHRINIHGPKYRKYGTSKAKKMRAFWGERT